MKILGIQTSTLAWSIAVVEEEQILGEYTFSSPARPDRRKAGGYKSLSKILVPAIEELLKKINIKSKDLGLIAVTTGPGSFTGGRIGLSAAKGLAMGLDIPVVGVSTLEVLASKVPFTSYPVCPIIPARGREVYTAVYRQLKEIKKTAAVNLEDWLDTVKKPTLFVGEGAIGYNDAIKKRLGELAVFAPGTLNYIKGSDVAFFVLGKKHIDVSEISSLNLKAEYWSSPVKKPARKKS
jgi:tRNA threonylcarbamoyladenosine biosynthesis protein TsaB